MLNKGKVYVLWNAHLNFWEPIHICGKNENETLPKTHPALKRASKFDNGKSLKIVKFYPPLIFDPQNIQWVRPNVL